MAIPKVAIVGRPNVGKSSILNWLSGKRISVVDPTAGVTRDRVKYLMHEEDRYFELIDTGGIGIVDVDDLTEEINQQIEIGINEADVIVFVLDGAAGVTPLDVEVSRRLRRINKPKLLVINKCDSPKLDDEVAPFHALADAPIEIVSVKGNRNRSSLMEAILELLPPPAENEEDEGTDQSSDPELKLAIVGRRNVGKSTFINTLAEEERMIVSEIAGTTRDSVDVRFEMDGKAFVAIDTPGVRKRKSLANDIEWYGLARAKRSIRRASVVLMFFDCTVPVSRVDKQLVGEIIDEVKPCIFVVNKWDMRGDQTFDDWNEYMGKLFPSMRHVPMAFITGLNGRNVKKLINLAQSVYKQARQRVGTGELNRVVRNAVANWPHPMRKNRNVRIYYATQVGVEPPTIVLKCNEASLIDDDWKRYLLGVMREQLPFKEVPLKIYFRSKESLEEAAAAARAPARSRGQDDDLPDDMEEEGLTDDDFDDEDWLTDEVSK